MTKSVHLSRNFIVKAMLSEGVRGKLRERAEKLKQQAETIAYQEKVAGEFDIREGIRPQGRPYTSVHFDNVDQEYGTSKTERSRILGRAARG